MRTLGFEPLTVAVSSIMDDAVSSTLTLFVLAVTLVLSFFELCVITFPG